MKDIKGYEGLYSVTEDGKVYSHRRNIFLKPRVKPNNYLEVILKVQGEQKAYLVHRLVAEAYIPNPDNKPTVNHKDENKQNNNINNLEWMTSAENNSYGKRTSKTEKAVYCVELDKVFRSQSFAASELNIHRGSIGACCRGERKSAGGYHWRFADELLDR